MENVKRLIVDRDKLPKLFPTHTHLPQFWEHLGRAVGTVGFLEEMLGKAIFAFTGSQQCSVDEAKEALKEWQPKLEGALTDSLHRLAESYRVAAQEGNFPNMELVNDAVDRIKDLSRIRNVLCHASWRPPDSYGKSLPFFVNRNMEVFETTIDVSFLLQVQEATLALVCDVIDSVKQMGWRFPGE